MDNESKPPEVNDEAAKRAEASKRRAEERKRKREEEESERRKQEQRAAWESDFEKLLPDAETVSNMVGAGLEAARASVRADIESAAQAFQPLDASEAELLEKFRARCVVGDLEKFCLAAGATGLILKYRAHLVRFAPEMLTAAGVLLLIATQMRLRREAKEVIDAFKRSRATPKRTTE